MNKTLLKYYYIIRNVSFPFFKTQKYDHWSVQLIKKFLNTSLQRTQGKNDNFLDKNRSVVEQTVNLLDLDISQWLRTCNELKVLMNSHLGKCATSDAEGSMKIVRTVIVPEAQWTRTLNTYRCKKTPIYYRVISNDVDSVRQYGTVVWSSKIFFPLMRMYSQNTIQSRKSWKLIWINHLWIWL